MNNNPIGLYLISFHYKTPSNSFYLLAPVISSTEVTETRYHMKAPSPKDRIHAGRISPRGKDGNLFYALVVKLMLELLVIVYLC